MYLRIVCCSPIDGGHSNSHFFSTFHHHPVSLIPLLTIAWSVVMYFVHDDLTLEFWIILHS